MTDRYAVFGNPIAQSKSPMIHSRFAAETGQDMSYGKIKAPVDGFAPVLRSFIAEGGKGCNITAPFKLDAFAMATEMTEAARLAGSTNTLRIDGARIEAHNTDGVGLLRDIEDNLGHTLRGKRVLMLGAGGAVRGAALPFLKAEPACFALLNRSRQKAATIRDMLSDHGEITLADPERSEGFDVIVNGTSSSLTGGCPALPQGVFDGCALAYDMSYGKGLTPFLKAAREAGVGDLADGVGMLVEQAAEAFAWWRGVTPATKALIAEMTIPLE